ncbi:hypothetical protein P5673_027724, partial [Acropora cervicornis]
LRYDGYSQHLFTKPCSFFRVWHIVLARFLGFFDVTHDEASSLDICQHHRDRMGIYWRGRCKNCQVPPEVAQHKSAAVKGDRTLVKDQFQYIKKITGKLIPVGSGFCVSRAITGAHLKGGRFSRREVSAVCRECRRLLAASKQPERQQSPIDRPSKTRCTQKLRTGSTLSTTPKKLDLSWNIVGTEVDVSDDSDDEVIVGNSRQKISEKLDAINKLLSLAGHGPITRTLHVGWVDATPKTQKYYTSKMEEVVSSVLEIIAPYDAGLLWSALKASPSINDRYNEPRTESSLLNALIESYKQATHSSTRKNILSVIADKLTFNDLQKLIPGLSRSRFTAARRHGVQYGAEALATQIGKKKTILRQKIDPAQVEHFIEFITSQKVIQDLPFGTRKLRLTSGEEVNIPNVIRLLIPSRLVDQYLHFCHETGFKPLGKSTLLQVIAESCGASVRKCMQGLDNYLAEGTRAFDDLRLIVNKLSQAGLTNEKVTKLQESLTEAKQYLKGDYKVHVSMESSIADHCIKFAMSDGNDCHYQARCNHEHNQMCDSTNLSSGGRETSQTTRMFSCPEQSCTKTFIRYSALERHCEFGAHTRSLERITLQDRAKISYAKNLHEGQTSKQQSLPVCDAPLTQRASDTCRM